ncbi:hypothetical protein V1289_009592 [Bradyrhizobium sp. AZCC 2289]
MSGRLKISGNNRLGRTSYSTLPAERCPPDCWRKTRIVRVGGPRLGPFKLSGTSGALTAFDKRGWRH